MFFFILFFAVFAVFPLLLQFTTFKTFNIYSCIAIKQVGRVKRERAFEHARNGRIHINLHMRKYSSEHFIPLKHSVGSNDSVCGQRRS